MGYKQSPGLIVVALLLSTPLAYGQLQNNKGIVRGRICCTSTGNCSPRSIAVPGLEMKLNCTDAFGREETLGQGITDSGGRFSVPINTTVYLVAPL
ncbi:hypothetical protein AAHA92_30619 [Salvia divinorum]|uniref:Carboxypeptidase regulatory-like domain-containing protein n=1 Tax=Salvia divinorum TaxID=28513 RepID=A0ABD1FU09_SALDI